MSYDESDLDSMQEDCSQRAKKQKLTSSPLSCIDPLVAGHSSSTSTACINKIPAETAQNISTDCTRDISTQTLISIPVDADFLINSSFMYTLDLTS